ncbi:MAG TPA: MoaD/ThiS family protein [Caulobacteraceae bacterium]|nr:MoaD/ThiS family protein [Caulobacteraceae bacterium]
MIEVRVPSQLTAYTEGATRVSAKGATVDDVLHDLDQRFRGIRFRVIDEQGRVRRHMRIFLGREAVVDLAQPVRAGDSLMIFGALSGG